MNEVEFEGEVIGITKVDTEEGRAIKCTLSGGVYFELTKILSEEDWKKLRGIDLGKILKVRIEI